jgi:post-segregation antitoxin (ccd killing protein)
MGEKKKREATSIKIDPELWKEAKIEAIRRDMEVSELVEMALRKELGLRIGGKNE